MSTPPPSPPAAAPRWRRRAAIAAAVVAGLFVALVAFGYWAVPAIVKAKLESTLLEETGRKASVGKVAFDPFTLTATISDFTLAERTPGAPVLAFDTLTLDVSSASLWRLAPVFDAVRLTRPRVALARRTDGTYSVQDLIDRFNAAPPGPPPSFSINNIEIDDGALTFDDAPHRRTHTVTGIDVGIPFLSSLAYAAQIRVTPRLAAVVNGSPFRMEGSVSSPFADVMEAALDVNVDALPLPRYVEYVPLPIAAKLTDGTLTTRLKVAFVTQGGAPRQLTVGGTARVEKLKLAGDGGAPLLSVAAIDATIAETDVLARTVKLARLAIDAPEAALKRLPDGTLEVARLAAPARAAPRAAATGNATPSWTVSVADASLTGGTLAVDDASVNPPFATTLTAIAVTAKGFTTGAGPPAKMTVAFDSGGARLEGNADVDVRGVAAKGHFALSKFDLARLYPYYAAALALDVRRGALALAGDFEVAAGATPLQVKLTKGDATLSDLDLGVSDEAEALWRVPELKLAGIDFDLAAHRVAIETVEGQKAAMSLVHEADGSINFARIVRTTAETGAPGGDATWAYNVRRIALERLTADVEDRAVSPVVRLKLDDVRAVGQNFGNARGAKGTIDVRARTGAGGRIGLAGTLGTNPVAADWQLDAAGLDLLSLKPYVESRTNLLVTGGKVAAKGRLAFDTAAPGGVNVVYTGDVTVSDFGSLDRPTGHELVRFGTLALTGVDTASAPPQVSIGAIALDAFFARIIVNPDATLNLQKLLAPPDGAADAGSAAPTASAATAPLAAAAPPPDAKAAARSERTEVTATARGGPAGRLAAGSARAAAALAEVAAPLSGDAALPVSIGRIEVTNGSIRFSDFFVKPNYTANLTDVAGSVSALSPTQAGDVAFTAKVEHLAPVEISGKVSPFAHDLTLDLTAKARDIDLPPLTPYAAKYAGYGIEKGKMSFDVHYTVADRKLSAQNKLVLDQLTFGARVDSPDATKLPVQLAVALLKDRNGVIDIDLPIAGSLDDPQFSVGGLIVRVIVNLITKVVTAPFAVLGALAGHGAELAYVEFAPGSAAIGPAAEAKLKALAKALVDRPALKLDVTGRAIPDVDREGLKRARLDAELRTQRQKTRAAANAETAAEATAIPPAEYPALLAAVYAAAPLPDKPKNALGFAKDLPPAEMESMLLASYTVDDQAFNDLANRRAQAVKSWLTDEGGVPSDRVFLVASKLTADGVKDGAPTRVDFALK